jgi:hypothetical protein
MFAAPTFTGAAQRLKKACECHHSDEGDGEQVRYAFVLTIESFLFNRLPCPPPCDGGRQQSNYSTNCIPGGFQVPSPGGRMEGGVSFGQ